ncbi:hypothetical protein VTK73DRAFT_3091 [Phialemonium thermophilum]|uniref:Uncharacterized protein n=1 Tax=Phialemonium thermophilum TaxID=223376 RepID=A0ABR3X0G3_9PEZI
MAERILTSRLANQTRCPKPPPLASLAPVHVTMVFSVSKVGLCGCGGGTLARFSMPCLVKGVCLLAAWEKKKEKQKKGVKKGGGDYSSANSGHSRRIQARLHAMSDGDLGINVLLSHSTIGEPVVFEFNRWCHPSDRFGFPFQTPARTRTYLDLREPTLVEVAKVA